MSDPTSVAPPPGNEPSDIRWWEVVGTFFISLFLFVFIIASCKFFLEKCCRCRCGEDESEDSSRRAASRSSRSRRRRARSARQNPGFEAEDLPPDYYNIHVDEPVVFRVATIEDDLNRMTSRSRASSATDKLPTYDDIIAKRKTDVENKAIFTISNELVLMGTIATEGGPSESSRSIDEEVAVSTCSLQSSLGPPTYTDEAV